MPTTDPLQPSIAAMLELLGGSDLGDETTFDRALGTLRARRAIDLSRLPPARQAELVASRTQHLLPSADDLASRIERRRGQGKALHVKFGIDPTSPDIHLGHAVPMVLAGRFQRMGHDVTLIVGDITASIGDPSGRLDERPALTGDDIAANMAQYRDQMAPLFDFSKAALRHNSEWLAPLKLVDLLPLLAKVPVSQSMQRDDFRDRLSSGHSLTMAEQLYSVVMAMDSVELNCDVEIGGVDQLLNMQMCRTLMAIKGQESELICTMPLIEGTDGSGTKMSKSRGNYVGIADPPAEIYGKLMSIPDRLTPQYFRMLTEITDDELDVAVKQQQPQHLKHLLAATVVDTLAGSDAASEARAAFLAHFRDRRLSATPDLPVVARDETSSVGKVLVDVLAFAPSLSHCRRTAEQGGLQLVIEVDGETPEKRKLVRDDVDRSIADVVAAAAAVAEPGSSQQLFLKLGRKAAALR
jgi:tyrosyl-tRNA synthetase